MVSMSLGLSLGSVVLMGRATGTLWDPSSPTTSGGVSPHTWHYAGSGAVYQDSGETTLVSSDGDIVGSSVNQGSDNHSLSEAINKPTWQDAELNGEPVFRFDGTNDKLVGAFTGALAQPFVLVAVVKLDATIVNDGVRHDVIVSDDATNLFLLRKQENTGGADFWRLYAGTSLDDGAPSSSAMIYMAIVNGASSELVENGTSLVSGDAGAANPDGLSLGAYFNGTNPSKVDIAEILIYNSNLNIADKNEIGNYLAQKYGLAWNTIT